MVDRAFVDYLLLPKRILGRLLDVTVWRGEGESSAEIGGWMESKKKKS